jgi:hypothetical protein
MSAINNGFNRSGVLILTTLVLAVAALFAASPAGAAIQLESFKFETTDAGGAPTQQSSGHPDASVTTFAFAEDANNLPLEQPRNIIVDLPAGLVGGPAAVPICTEAQLSVGECPIESQVGVIVLATNGTHLQWPIYNMKAPPGVLAQFGIFALTVTVHLVATVHSEPEYGTTVATRNVPQPIAFTAQTITFWGVPGDESHDEYRGPCLGVFGPSGNKCASHLAKVLPFLTNPSACSATSIAFGHVDSWPTPGVFASAEAGNENPSGEPIGITGCELPEFEPTVEARPTTNVADSPSGLDVKIHLDQNEDPEGLATAQLRDATLSFPAGMTVNPSSAGGLDACSPAQIGLTTPVGQPVAHFNEAPISCPNASRLGTVQLTTPLLTNPLKGNMYLASQGQNPFGSLLALYMVVEDPATGVLIKIAGQATPDPTTGQLTVTFPQNPQLPFEDLSVNLFPGSRGALKTPNSCGNFTTNSEMVPWTAPDGATKNPVDTFGIIAGANNSACLSSEAAAPNKPSFSAGTTDPTAGAYSPFVLKVSREDGTQPIKAIDTTLPKGLIGKIAGIPYCPEAAIAAAAAKSGKAEQASPSCPAASELGSVNVGAGAGSTPLNVGGKAYLAGPYKGAPLSLAIVTPAVAGPFDLGTVVVRVALQIDPESTQIHAVSDPIPTILQGIPLDIRSIAIAMDKPGFTLNPTSCSPSAVTGAATSVFDQNAALSTPFQVGGCNALGFKPSLAIDLKGGTKRGQHPALKATLKARPGDSNIARAVVSLPHSEFLAQNHIKTICTRVQFAANSCPKGSIYGTAKATTPLLDKPISGPVYLRSSSHSLPDLVVDLGGQIPVVLAGRIDSINGGIRNSFEVVPDAPVSKFVLEMQGGKKGLLENSRNLCASTNLATVEMDGHNGKVYDSKPALTNDCKSKAKKHAKKHQPKKG